MFLNALLVVVLVVLVSPSMAAEPCREHEISIDGVGLSAVSPNSTVFDLVDASAALMRTQLDLPLPRWRKVYLCNDENAFAEGVLRNFGARAWSLGVPSSAGLATPVGIFLRGDYLARLEIADRVALIAHELAHLSQEKLGGHHAREVPLWIIEGHAEWVAFKVVERLGQGSYEANRAEVARSLSPSAISPTRLPGLEELEGAMQWQRTALRLNRAATYGQAFLAVDWLVQRHGVVRLVEYLGNDTSDARDRWPKTFPISYREFVDEFNARLRLASWTPRPSVHEGVTRPVDGAP